MKEFINIMLIGLELVFMSISSIVSFILTFEVFKLIVNATGFTAIGYFLIMIFFLAIGIFLVACVGIIGYDSDEATKNVEGDSNGPADN